jgi:hypothetical protein
MIQNNTGDSRKEQGAAVGGRTILTVYTLSNLLSVGRIHQEKCTYRKWFPPITLSKQVPKIGSK